MKTPPLLRPRYTRVALTLLTACLALESIAEAQQGRRPGGRRQAQTLPSDEAVLARAPEGVKILTNLAYREGNDAWKVDLAMPSDQNGKPRPGIVFVHGGGWRNGDKRAGSFLNGAIDYAAKGYVCITVNYRLSDDAPFPACVEDVKGAVRWFRANAERFHLDPNRIGGFGNSAGAHLVSMLGLVGPEAELEGDGPHSDESSLLQAVCASATPTDLLNWKNGLKGFGRPGALLAGPADTLEERAAAASPITYVSEDAPPFLLFHGTNDRTVDVVQSDTFVEALKEAGAEDITYLRINDAGHGVFNQHASETNPAMEEFFARVLEGDAPSSP